jgi:hypothetical protein
MLRILSFITLSMFSFACLAQENDSLFIIKEINKSKIGEHGDASPWTHKQI